MCRDGPTYITFNIMSSITNVIPKKESFPRFPPTLVRKPDLQFGGIYMISQHQMATTKGGKRSTQAAKQHGNRRVSQKYIPLGPSALSQGKSYSPKCLPLF